MSDVDTIATPRSLAQKIIARAAGRPVLPGEIVTCRVDLAMSHDSSGPRRVAPMLAELGAKVWDPSRYVIITDHYLPAADDESRNILKITRDWVKSAGIEHFYDGQGICHVVLPERGHIRPGMMIVGGDSHASTGGAFGSYMFGVGATEMLGVLVTGEIWLKVPETLLFEWHGRFAEGVCAKDVMLFLCGRFGLDGGQYQALEFGGSAVRALSMQERMTLANMSVELGGQVGLVAPDEITQAYLRQAGVEVDGAEMARWQSDQGAPLAAHHRYAAADLVPQVAAPHSPANAAPAADYGGQAIDVAYLGACTGAKLDDLRMAAQVLAGRRIAAGVTLMVAPASRRDQERAEAEGIMTVLADAGAQFLANACGACAGYGQYRFGDGVRVMASTARNFKGRMGSAASRIWLGSPYSVAAAACAGEIVDPREFISTSMAAFPPTPFPRKGVTAVQPLTRHPNDDSLPPRGGPSEAA